MGHSSRRYAQLHAGVLEDKVMMFFIFGGLQVQSSLFQLDSAIAKEGIREDLA